MPVYLLNEELSFPPATHAESDGLLAIGGDLSPARILLAYQSGIFPWYDEDSPILWHSPNPRMTLESHNLKINKSLKKSIRKQPYKLTLDTAFEQVIRQCSSVPRPGQDGTWLVDEMINVYISLHEQGYAHSVEAWQGDKLVGGLYGISLGSMFFGESMYALAPNASKIAFTALIKQMQEWGITLIDCQVYTDYLAKFGATLWSQEKYLKSLERALAPPTRKGKWLFENDFEGRFGA